MIMTNPMSLYDLHARTIDGRDQSFADYRGKVLLVVNVASKCGFTGQYAGLEELYRKHKDEGFLILGFPCDQFGHQEPGTEAEIQQFCSTTYNVTFPMFAKVNVNGDDAHPVYQFLKNEKKGLLGTSAVKWNFSKFLVSRTGEVVDRYSAATGPASLEDDVKKLLAEPS